MIRTWAQQKEHEAEILREARVEWLKSVSHVGANMQATADVLGINRRILNQMAEDHGVEFRKYNRSTHPSKAAIAKAIADGLSHRAACDRLACGSSTLIKWTKNYGFSFRDRSAAEAFWDSSDLNPYSSARMKEVAAKEMAAYRRRTA